MRILGGYKPNKFRTNIISVGAIAASTLVLGVTVLASQPPISAKEMPDDAEYSKTIKPAIDQFCVRCHGTKNSAGGIDLTQYPGSESVTRNPEVWRKVVRQLKTNAYSSYLRVEP